MRLKRLIASLLAAVGFSVRRTTQVSELEILANFAIRCEFLSKSPKTKHITIEEAAQIVSMSKSQLGQDVLALAIQGTIQPGFFVEFGATNGVDLSNSYLLEKSFGWSGILSEPAKNWHPDLKANRDSKIDFRCVLDTSGQTVSFSETTLGELSTLTDLVNSDSNKLLRKKQSSYEVETISLIDLLDYYNAPSHIEFLSVDTEGSEFAILEKFDFARYTFGLICVEHNFTNNREKLFGLLSSKGYKRIYEEYSQFDDWYIPA